MIGWRALPRACLTGLLLTTPAPTTTGPSTIKNVLVEMLLFNNSPPPTFTSSDVTGTMFSNANSVTQMYTQTSYGTVLIAGSVVGPYTVNFPAPTSVFNCTASAYESAADAQATAAGINLATYTNRMYVLQPGAICGENAVIGGTTSVISGTILPEDYAHELGHNLGMGHAQSLDCVTLQISDFGCTVTDYLDASDFMGVTYAQLNAQHRIFLNWMGPPRVTNVTSSGTFTVPPLENGGIGSALTIPRPFQGNAYSVSFRQPIGLDAAAFPPGNEFIIGSSIHLLGGNTSQLIDTTPGDGDTTNDTLLDGLSFGDPTNGIKITQLSHSSAGAVVQVTIALPYVDTIPPTVSFSPASGFAARLQHIAIAAADDVGVTRVELYKDNTLILTSSTPPYSFNWDTTAEINGSSHTIQAKAYDAAGNIGVSAIGTFTVVNVAPSVSISSPTNGATVSGTININMSGSNTVGLGFPNIIIDGITESLGGGCCQSPTFSGSLSWPTALTKDGSHTLAANLTDSAGNVGTSPTITVTTANGVSDTIPPTTTITTPSGTTDSNGFITIRATASDNLALGRVEFFANSGLVCNNSISPYGTASVSTLCLWNITRVIDGNYNVQTTAFDTSGNSASSAPVSVSVFGGIDNIPPTVPSNFTVAAAHTQATLNWSASSDSHGVQGYKILKNNSAIRIGVACCTYIDTVVTPGTMYTYSVEAYDGSGNFSAPATPVTVTIP